MTIQEAAAQVLRDALTYLDALTPAAYTTPIALMSDSTIGQHTRHFVEFFQCLIGQAHDGGSINYDLRRRDHQIEANPAFAAACIRRILVELPTLPMGMETQLEASYDLNGTRGFSISTSLERELMYNVEHTIHHLALVKIGLRLVVPEYVVPQHFGVAVSTIKYQQSIEKGLPSTLVGHA